MKLRNSLLKCILIGGCVSVSLISFTGCTKKVETTNETNVEQSVNVETEVELTEEEQIAQAQEQIEDLTKAEEIKTVEEVENKANMVMEYSGFIKSFTYEGSRGMLELVVGEPNTAEVENMLFTLNLDNIMFDAMNNRVLAPNGLMEGDTINLYAMDNSKTSAITPIAIAKSPTSDLKLIAPEKIENFSVKDVNVHILEDKYSSTLICVDDSTIIENAYNGEPVQVTDLKDTDKLFVKTTEHEYVDTTEKGENGKETEKVETEEDKVIKDMYANTKRASYISVYKSIE